MTHKSVNTNSSTIARVYGDRRVIVSLTSYPERINSVSTTIMTLFAQTLVPDMVVLWLSEEEFPQKEKALPADLLCLKEYGLSIMWCENLMSHKKYYYSMMTFPEDIIITVDDDIYYSPKLVEILYRSYLRYPDCISCMRAHDMEYSDEEIRPYAEWKQNDRRLMDHPSHSLCATGSAGVLYPPHILPDITFDRERIRNICICQDDLWLKGMELFSDIKVVLTGNGIQWGVYRENGLTSGLFVNINRYGKNDLAIKEISDYLDELTGIRNYIIRKIDEEKTDDKIQELNKRFFDGIRKEVVIYGAGDGAELISDYLGILTDGRLFPKYYIVTNTTGMPNKKRGRSVISIDEYSSKMADEMMIVAVSEGKQEEIKRTLSIYGIKGSFYIRDTMFSRIRMINRLRNSIAGDFYYE